MQAAYVIKPGLVQLTEHYIRKAYYNNLRLTKTMVKCTIVNIVK